MFSRPYSRKLEAEADQVGLQLAAKVSLFPVCYYLKEHSTDFTLKVRCICHEEYYTAKKQKQNSCIMYPVALKEISNVSKVSAAFCLTLFLQSVFFFLYVSAILNCWTTTLT